jgi:adenosylmethionine-8-amino-7-oxononanoate aminotransferase
MLSSITNHSTTSVQLTTSAMRNPVNQRSNTSPDLHKNWRINSKNSALKMSSAVCLVSFIMTYTALTNSQVAAEPVVGATQGVTYAPKGYFAAISAVCRKHGALLIFDEVMCGMGRMGTSMHAWQGPNSYTDGVSPDIQAIAKGLGGGYGSIGAVLLNERVASGLQQGSKYLQHGHTYQAHPLAVAASLAVQDVLEEENLLEKAERVGTLLQQQLEQSLTGSNALSAPYIFDIRGGGCFWGVEFQFPEEVETKWFSKQRFGGLVQAAAMENGAVIIGMSGGIDGKKGDFIILAPAYNISDEEITEVVTKVTKSIEDVLKRTVLS